MVLVLASCTRKGEVLYRVQENGLFGFINKQGAMVITPQYKYVSAFSKEGVALVINELKLETDSSVLVNYGYINKLNQRINDGNIMKIKSAVVSFWNDKGLYDLVEKYNRGTLGFRSRVLSQLELRHGLYLYQDMELPNVIIGDKEMDLPKIGGDLFGYKDINNNIVIDAQFGVGREFHNGVAIVRMPTHEALVRDYYSDTVYFRGLNTWGAVNTSGEMLVDYDYFFIQDYIDDGTTWAMTVSVDDYGQFIKEWVEIDNKGTIIAGLIPNRIEWIYNNEKFPIVMFDFGFLGYYYTFIDKHGKFISDFDNDGAISLPLSEEGGRSEVFDDVIRFSNDVAGVHGNHMDKEGWFFIDKSFSVLSKAYDSIHPFSENMAAVKELKEFHREWGYVKKDPSTNSIIQAIPFSYSECGDFYNGLAYFSNYGNAFSVEGYIDTDGEIVWQTKRSKR